LRLRLAGNYVAGRCVLAGDAAHLVHPLAGQGMNLGFRDVRALRRTIDTARRRDADIGAAHVLRRYERERRSDNALAARGLDVIERAFAADNAALTALRSVAFATVRRIAPLQRLMTEIAAGR
jgi:2-octaprenylphenol hydroxylase